MTYPALSDLTWSAIRLGQQAPDLKLEQLFPPISRQIFTRYFRKAVNAGSRDQIAQY
jgi:hypothetical protein